MNLKQFTIRDIRSWSPCYDPSLHISEDWKGDIIDLLKVESIPFRDKLWCALRTSVVSEKLIRLYAIKAAYLAEPYIKDERSKEALKVAEQYVNGLATKEQMLRAKLDAASAYASAYASASASAYAAAYAASASAYAAAYAASAYAASDYAASASAYAASAYAASDAAYAAARQKQVDTLITMIIKGIETGDSVLEVK